MVSSESLSDIFKAEDSESVDVDEFPKVTSTREVYLDNLNDSEVKIRTEDIRHERPDRNLVIDEDSEDFSSFFLHLSDEMDSNSDDGEEEVNDSDETYLSINASPFSSEENKSGTVNNDLNFGLKFHKNSPDMFDESQIIMPTKTKHKEPLEVELENNECNGNPEESSQEEILLELQSSQECSQSKRDSSDVHRISQIIRVPEDKDSQHELQCSQVSPQNLPGPIRNIPPSGRERNEVWSSQELSKMSHRFEIRRKQVRRLMMTVIRKRQMADETLDAFKKRLRRF